jgi:hypothetical protein
MLTIKRTCTNRIISRALAIEGQALIAILRPHADDCEPCENEAELLRLLQKDPTAMIVYNQQVDAMNLVNNLQLPTDQVFIEIRQDTRGVLGLHAIHKKPDQQVTLELNYQ